MTEPVTISLSFVARDLGLASEHVGAVIKLLEQEHPIPFIARYRKDAIGNLDEDHIRQIAERYRELKLLTERKQTILRSIEALGKLTPELEKNIREARSPRRLEDLYLPYKPKKQTLASVARERGLDEFAREILDGAEAAADMSRRAADFVRPDKGVNSAAEAILGAGHILSEMYAERLEIRQKVREIFQRSGRLTSRQIKPEVTEAPEATKAPEVIEVSEVETAAPELNVESPPESLVVTPEVVAPQATMSDENVAATPPVEAETVEAEMVEVAETAPVKAMETAPVENVENAAPGDSMPNSEAEPSREVAPSSEAEEKIPAPQTKGVKSGREKNGAKNLPKKRSLAEQKAEQDAKLYSDYFEFSAPIRNCPSYRVLAINRGERGKVLRVRIESDTLSILVAAKSVALPQEHPHGDFLAGCVTDALERLMIPSMEREMRRDLTDEAEKQAVWVFAKNLRNLLLQKPLFRRRVLAVDPGFRYGCKLVALDEFGNFLANETVYITGSSERRTKAAGKMAELIEKFNLSVIAIGNGTGCREAEDFVATMIAERFADKEIAYIIVNEAGASVYSVSPAAKEEFPHYDALVRGAVSIGRRLQDPLNELVKIDPASLGVGIYQHDIKAKHLKESLTEVVESGVNYVGVDLNCATSAILRYVSGLNQLTAKRIFEYRVEHGPFRYRDELKKVPGLGEATFTNAAGFLKISDGYEPLDATWIHPESYAAAEKILEKLGFTKDDLRIVEKRAELATKVKTLSAEELAVELGAGKMTVADILDQLARPGRDPRESLPAPIFKKGVMKLEDLVPGMELMGTVLNVVDFGAFVDIGLHDSGLIHISRMGDRFVRDAHQRLAVGDIVKVWVVEIEPKRRRISLSMLPPGTERKFEGRHERGGGESRSERPPHEGIPSGEARPPRQENRPPRGEGGSNSPSGSATADRRPRDGKSPSHSDGNRPATSGREDRQPSRGRPNGGTFGREGGPEGRSDGRNSDRQNNGRGDARGDVRGDTRSNTRSDARSDTRGGSDRREDRGRGRERFERRDKGPRTIVVTAKKEIAPLSSGMKEGKEPMRSFSDLAQLFGRVEPTPTAEKKSTPEPTEPKAIEAKPTEPKTETTLEATVEAKSEV